MRKLRKHLAPLLLIVVARACCFRSLHLPRTIRPLTKEQIKQFFFRPPKS